MSKVYKASVVVVNDQKFKLSTEIKKLDEQIIEDVVEDLNVVEQHGQSIIDDAKTESMRMLDEAQAESDQKLAEATETSNQIVSDAYDQAKGILEQAREGGFQEGIEKGYGEGKQISDRMIEEAVELKNAWQQQLDLLYQTAEQEMVELVIEVAQKILKKNVDSDRSYIQELILDSVREHTVTDTLKLKIAQDDEEYVVGVKDNILLRYDKIRDIEIVVDPNLEPGNVLIDMDSGSIDCGVWSQFEQVKLGFTDLLKRE